MGAAVARLCCWQADGGRHGVLDLSPLEIAHAHAHLPAPPTSSPRRRTGQQRQRRVAIKSEDSEMLASVRWHSAFHALKRAEPRTPEQTARIAATLRTVGPGFEAMEAPLLEDIVRAMRTVSVAPNEVVIRQGEAGEYFYVVGSGELDVFVGDVTPDATPCARLRPGGAFGELALLYDAPRSATVRCCSARGGATLYRLGRIHFRHLVWEAMARTKV